MHGAFAKPVQLLLCAGALLSLPAVVAQQPPFVIVAVNDRSGQTTNWRLDVSAGDSAVRLLRALKLGDALVVAGNPSTAAGEPRLRVTSISRPSDGFVWQR